MPSSRDTKINIIQVQALKDLQSTGRGRGYIIDGKFSGCKSCPNGENKVVETRVGILPSGRDTVGKLLKKYEEGL